MKHSASHIYFPISFEVCKTRFFSFPTDFWIQCKLLKLFLSLKWYEKKNEKEKIQTVKYILSSGFIFLRQDRTKLFYVYFE